MSHTYDSRYFYFTAGADGTRIDSDAVYHRAESKADMIARMQERCVDEVVDVAEGDFSDCWAKLLHEPEPHDFELWSQDYGLPVDSFIVRAPGTHPGGKLFWIDINIPIYVPVFKS